MIRTVKIEGHEIETDADVLVVILPNAKVKAALKGVLKRNKLKEGIDFLIEEGE